MNALRVERFKNVVLGLRNTPLILITQVDPDAMGSALALAEIIHCLRPEVRTSIAYCGEVGHPQNRAIMNKFDLGTWFLRIGDFPSLKNYDVILVDSSSTDESRIPSHIKPLKPVIVIDHHRGGLKHEVEGQFVWIDDVGAASTLIIELAQALGIPFSEPEDLMLALGIYIDTKSLVGASSRDRAAYALVTQTIAPEALKALIKYPLLLSYFKHLQHAIASVGDNFGPRIIASAGVISAQDGDDLAAIADTLIRMEGVSLVLVFGIVNGSIRISARSDDPSLPLDEKLKRWFGSTNAGAKLTPDGIGEGGGLIELNLGFWFSNATDEEKENIIMRKIRSLVLEK